MSSSPFESGELIWRYPKQAGDKFVLEAAGRPIGSLRFAADPKGRSLAELVDERWTLERSHETLVTVRSVGSEEPVARFSPCWSGGGVVTFHGGCCYSWTKTSVWSDKWCFRCKENEPAICLVQQAGPLTGGGKVTICGDPGRIEQISVLVFLAWYLRLLAFDRVAESALAIYD